MFRKEIAEFLRREKQVLIQSHGIPSQDYRVTEPDVIQEIENIDRWVAWLSRSIAEEEKDKGESTFRGHDVKFQDDRWVYADNGQPVPGFGGELRPCKLCGSEKWSGDGYADECLGILPGVKNACCGHGDPDCSYVVFESGVVLRNFVVAEKAGQEIEVNDIPPAAGDIIS